MAKYYFEKREIVWDINKFNTLSYGTTGTDTRWVTISPLTGDASVQATSPKLNEVGTVLGGSAKDIRDVLKWEKTNHLGRFEGRLLPKVSKTDLLSGYRTSGELIETIVADENEFPTNGIQGDYWYIRGEKAFPNIKIKGVGTVESMKIKTPSGIREVENVYILLNGQKVELI